MEKINEAKKTKKEKQDIKIKKEKRKGKPDANEGKIWIVRKKGRKRKRNKE